MKLKLNFSSLQVRVLVIAAAALGTAMAVSVGALTKVYASIQDLDRISREDLTIQQSILAQRQFSMLIWVRVPKVILLIG